ncbi:MAG: EFR1 family ferrodoxin [Bacteroidota bacterium]|nr:EFR1 family ferrodoxin [Bacteroidota bacterium]
MPTTLIHFFTGTGNTAHAVKTIAEDIRKAGQEVTTVQVSLGVNPPELGAFERHIVAFPVLSWAAPVMMRQYLKRFPKGEGKQVAILAVNGAVFYKGKMVPGASGQALEEVEHLLRRKGYDVFLSGEASFPDNWTQMTDPGDEKSQKIIITHGEADVRNFTEKFLSGKRELFRCSPFNHTWTYLVAFLFGKMGRRALGTFYIADSSCNGCGLCARQCPSHSIVMEHNRPRWKTNCQDCNRCINFCPEKAIQTSMSLLVIQFTLHILMIIYGIKAVSAYASLLIPVAPWLMILIKTVLIIAVLYLASWITLVPLYAFLRLLGKIPAVRKFYCLSVTKKFSRYKGPEYVMRKQEADEQNKI